MNILICDDIKAEIIEIEQMFKESGFDINIKSFTSGREALAYVQGEDVDVCFLDIIMPEISGVTLAEKLRASGYNGEIVFLTSSNEYAAESYKVKAFSYMLKPIKPYDVREVLNSLEKAKKKSDSDGIFIKASKTARIRLFGARITP